MSAGSQHGFEFDHPDDRAAPGPHQNISTLLETLDPNNWSSQPSPSTNPSISANNSDSTIDGGTTFGSGQDDSKFHTNPSGNVDNIQTSEDTYNAETPTKVEKIENPPDPENVEAPDLVDEIESHVFAAIILIEPTQNEHVILGSFDSDAMKKGEFPIIKSKLIATHSTTLPSEIILQLSARLSSGKNDSLQASISLSHYNCIITTEMVGNKKIGRLDMSITPMGQYSENQKSQLRGKFRVPDSIEDSKLSTFRFQCLKDDVVDANVYSDRDWGSAQKHIDAFRIALFNEDEITVLLYSEVAHRFLQNVTASIYNQTDMDPIQYSYILQNSKKFRSDLPLGVHPNTNKHWSQRPKAPARRPYKIFPSTTLASHVLGQGLLREAQCARQAKLTCNVANVKLIRLLGTSTVAKLTEELSADFQSSESDKTNFVASKFEDKSEFQVEIHGINRAYSVLMEFSGKEEWRPIEGDHLEINFQPGTEHSKKWFTVKILGYLTQGSIFEVFGELNRKWSREYKSFVAFKEGDIPHELSVPTEELTTLAKTREILANAKHTKVSVRVETWSLEYDRADAALRRFQDLKNVSLNTIRAIVNGTKLNKLPLTNMFADLPEVIEFANQSFTREDFESFFTGHHRTDQLPAKMGARIARGGINLISGPPGSGKTTVAMDMVQLLLNLPPKYRGSKLNVKKLENGRGYQALIVAPFNETVSSLCLREMRRAVEFRRKHKLEELGMPIFIRVFAKSTDFRIFNYDAHQKRPADSSERSALLDAISFDDQNLKDLIGAIQIRKQVESAGKTETPIPDPRLKTNDWDLSLGSWIEYFLHQDHVSGKHKHMGLYIMLQNYAFGVDLDDSEDDSEDDEKNEFAIAYNKLRDQVLGSADAIFTTTSLALQASISDFASPDILVFEEAAKIHDVRVTALLALYPQAPIRLFIGDVHQGKPFSIHQSEDGKVRSSGVIDNVVNPFHANFVYSAFERYQFVGHAHTQLEQQSRAVPEIASTWSECFSNGAKVLSSSSLQENPLLMQARAFMKEQFDIDYPVVLVSVNSTGTKQVNSTRVNLETSGVGVQIVEKLLESGFHPTDLAVLSPYRGQKALYQRACQAYLEDIKGYKHMDQILTETFDRSQGEERAVVVMDYPNTDNQGFLFSKARHYMAASRAKFGLIVVADSDAIQKSEKAQKSPLLAFVKLLIARDHAFSFTKDAIPPEFSIFMPDPVECSKMQLPRL